MRRISHARERSTAARHRRAPAEPAGSRNRQGGHHASAGTLDVRPRSRRARRARVLVEAVLQGLPLRHRARGSGRAGRVRSPFHQHHSPPIGRGTGPRNRPHLAASDGGNAHACGSSALLRCAGLQRARQHEAPRVRSRDGRLSRRAHRQSDRTRVRRALARRLPLGAYLGMAAHPEPEPGGIPRQCEPGALATSPLARVERGREGDRPVAARAPARSRRSDPEEDAGTGWMAGVLRHAPDRGGIAESPLRRGCLRRHFQAPGSGVAARMGRPLCAAGGIGVRAARRAGSAGGGAEHERRRYRSGLEQRNRERSGPGGAGAGRARLGDLRGGPGGAARPVQRVGRPGRIPQ